MTAPHQENSFSDHCIAAKMGKLAVRKNISMSKAVTEAAVLVPGLGNDSSIYVELLSEFDARGVAAISIDLPGFGHSDHLPEHESYSLRYHAEAVTRIVNDLNIGCVHLVLHSMATGVINPGLMFTPKSISLLEGNIISEDAYWASEVAKLTDDAEFEKYASRLIKHRRRIVLQSVYAPLSEERIMDIADSYSRMDLRAFRQTSAENYQKTIDGSYAAALEKQLQNKIPVLYIRGGKSPSWSGNATLDKLGLQLTKIEGAGHMMMLDAPDLLARTLCDHFE